jgi:hypothetical protein
MQHWIIHDPQRCGKIAGLITPQDALFLVLEGISTEDGATIEEAFNEKDMTAAVAVMPAETAGKIWSELSMLVRSKAFSAQLKEQSHESVLAKWTLADERVVILAGDNNCGSNLNDVALAKFGEYNIPSSDWMVREGLHCDNENLPNWLELLAPEVAPKRKRTSKA